MLIAAISNTNALLFQNDYYQYQKAIAVVIFLINAWLFRLMPFTTVFFGMLWSGSGALSYV